VTNLLSKNPLEILKDKEFSQSELAQALRLGIIAELDAINLYLQMAERVKDEKLRKVFEDIAKEEKTHVGEFLTLLKSLDPEQVAELEAGSKEVEELTGIKVNKDPEPAKNEGVENTQVPEIFSQEEWKSLVNSFVNSLNVSRKLRKYIPILKVGEGVEAVSRELVTEGNVVKSKRVSLLPLKEIAVKFSINQRELQNMRRYGLKVDLASARYAASKMGLLEDKYLLEGDKALGEKGLLNEEGALRFELSDWSIPGNAVKDVSKAVSELIKEGVPEPYLLVVSPAGYSSLIAVHERTGVMELQRVKALVKDIAVVPSLPEGFALIISVNPAVLDLVAGVDLKLDYVGPEDGEYLFRAWETLVLRIKYPKAVIILGK